LFHAAKLCRHSLMNNLANNVDQMALALYQATIKGDNQNYALKGKAIAMSVFDSKKISLEIKSFLERISAI